MFPVPYGHMAMQMNGGRSHRRRDHSSSSSESSSGSSGSGSSGSDSSDDCSGRHKHHKKHHHKKHHHHHHKHEERGMEAKKISFVPGRIVPVSSVGNQIYVASPPQNPVMSVPMPSANFGMFGMTPAAPPFGGAVNFVPNPASRCLYLNGSLQNPAVSGFPFVSRGGTQPGSSCPYLNGTMQLQQSQQTNPYLINRIM